MLRNTAREIAVHLAYELSFTDKTVEALLEDRLTAESFAQLAEEDPLYAEVPNAKQAAYIKFSELSDDPNARPGLTIAADPPGGFGHYAGGDV